jgi:hypothetical protein
MLGYVLGVGDTQAKLTGLEFHRYRYASDAGAER